LRYPEEKRKRKREKERRTLQVVRPNPAPKTLLGPFETPCSTLSSYHESLVDDSVRKRECREFEASCETELNRKISNPLFPPLFFHLVLLSFFHHSTMASGRPKRTLRPSRAALDAAASNSYFSQSSRFPRDLTLQSSNPSGTPHLPLAAFDLSAAALPPLPPVPALPPLPSFPPSKKRKVQHVSTSRKRTLTPPPPSKPTKKVKKANKAVPEAITVTPTPTNVVKSGKETSEKIEDLRTSISSQLLPHFPLIL